MVKQVSMMLIMIMPIISVMQIYSGVFETGPAGSGGTRWYVDEVERVRITKLINAWWNSW